MGLNPEDISDVLSVIELYEDDLVSYGPVIGTGSDRPTVDEGFSGGRCRGRGLLPDTRRSGLRVSPLDNLTVTGKITILSDVVLLYPTCHRAAHRTNPWPTLKMMRALHPHG